MGQPCEELQLSFDLNEGRMSAAADVGKPGLTPFAEKMQKIDRMECVLADLLQEPMIDSIADESDIGDSDEDRGCGPLLDDVEKVLQVILMLEVICDAHCMYFV